MPSGSEGTGDGADMRDDMFGSRGDGLPGVPHTHGWMVRGGMDREGGSIRKAAGDTMAMDGGAANMIGRGKTMIILDTAGDTITIPGKEKDLGMEEVEGEGWKSEL